MSVMRQLRNYVSRFKRGDGGMVSVETVLVIPILTWLFVALFVFFDGYKTRAVNLKAAYTIADMLSREQISVDQAYIDGMNLVYDFLTNSPDDTVVRTTVARYIEGDDCIQVFWSATSNGNVAHPPRTAADLPEIADRIPTIADGDSVIIVETWMTYQPPFRVGVPELEMASLVTTRPRFLPQLPFDNNTPDETCAAMSNGGNGGGAGGGGTIGG